LARTLPDGISNETTTDETGYSFVFTLDDLSGSGGLTSSNTYPRANYQSGSRASEVSITSTGVEQWKTVLQSGFGQFTMPLIGGFNGLDITEKEPFRNTLLDGKTSKTNSAYNSIKRAIDTVKDPEVVEFNLATVPGLTNQTLNEHLITTCESRGDALAIIDLKGDYVPTEENNSAFSARVGNVDTTVTNLLARGLNSSYGCAYYPWVQIRDEINNSLLWAPPSVVALGVMASGEKSSELWFAPAGFTRGGLTDGAAGVPVVSVAQRLTSKDRDKLYEANINPIATFPAEGIVVFGQKTLQVTPSALDRINVRRLLIYVKKEISRMAATTLFQQNVQRTWNHFLGRAEPFLRSVQVRLGLNDFKVVLDETTTTPDLVDRNIMYAKIFLKPTKAIEFIALDFVITDSGASFED
jgi:phage tail sheath protein FI